MKDDTFNRDLQDLLTTLHINGEDNGYAEIEADLLGAAMQELIASDWYNKISPDRKKDLFIQYAKLNTVLGSLRVFTQKYADLNVNELSY